MGKIVEVKFHYPSLMAPTAEEDVKKLYAEIEEAENNIADFHETINLLNDRLKVLRKEWDKILSIADIIYESSIEELFDNVVRKPIIGFKFSSDINKDVH